jgi:hypothetical protein
VGGLSKGEYAERHREVDGERRIELSPIALRFASHPLTINDDGPSGPDGPDRGAIRSIPDLTFGDYAGGNHGNGSSSSGFTGCGAVSASGLASLVSGPEAATGSCSTVARWPATSLVRRTMRPDGNSRAS